MRPTTKKKKTLNFARLRLELLCRRGHPPTLIQRWNPASDPMCEGFLATLPFKHAENTSPSCQVRTMRRKQGQSHAKTHKQDYSERELKKKNGGARAGCACVKAGLEPGPLLHSNIWMTLVFHALFVPKVGVCFLIGHIFSVVSLVFGWFWLVIKCWCHYIEVHDLSSVFTKIVCTAQRDQCSWLLSTWHKSSRRTRYSNFLNAFG